MKDTLTKENRRDFHARYNHTYGWISLPDNDKPILVYISAVTEDKLVFNIGTKINYEVYIDSGVQFDFIPVHRGLYNGDDNHLYFVERVPARQWLRGIADTNTHISRWEGFWKKLHTTLPVLRSIFESKKEIARDLLEKDKIVVALSTHFAIVNSQLFFYNKCIGEKIDKKVFKLNDSIVQQELSDLSRRNNYGLTFV